MRIVHGIFVVSVLLFLTGIGFVIAGARAARDRPARAPASTMTPVASVKQIMNAIVAPAADTVFGAVSTVITAQGAEEHAPQNDKEWERLGTSAAALIEAGNLMMMGSRAVDQGDWVKYAHDLIEGSKIALKAAESRDAAGVFDSGEAIYLSCDGCHQKYQRAE
jgi:hypothetical protein